MNTHGTEKSRLLLLEYITQKYLQKNVCSFEEDSSSEIENRGGNITVHFYHHLKLSKGKKLGLTVGAFDVITANLNNDHSQEFYETISHIKPGDYSYPDISLKMRRDCLELVVGAKEVGRILASDVLKISYLFEVDINIDRISDNQFTISNVRRVHDNVSDILLKSINIKCHMKKIAQLDMSLSISVVIP